MLRKKEKAESKEIWAKEKERKKEKRKEESKKHKREERSIQTEERKKVSAPVFFYVDLALSWVSHVCQNLQ